MGRSTVYNQITSPELIEQINKDNIQLMDDFLIYLKSVDRSDTTINGYRNDLLIFFCWNVNSNGNKYFIDLTKREVAKFQNHAINEWNWSSSRIRRVKSALSSLSSYIENILDDEIKDYKPIIKKIENPIKTEVREKTILTIEQVEELLEKLVAEGREQAACAVALAAYSGARKSELVRFKVDYFKDEYIIFNSIYKTPEKIKTKGRGNKYGKQLYKYVLIDFKKYFDIWMKKREELGVKSEWLFVSRDKDNGYVQAKASIMNGYAECCSRILDLPFYFHSLRHMLTTLMAGRYHIPSKVIQEYFGWSSTALVDIYDDTEVADTFGDYFSKDGIKECQQGSLNSL